MCGIRHPLRPRQHRRHIADDIFKCIFLNKNLWISLKISLKFVPKVPIINIPTLVQIMAWLRPGDKPLSEPIIVSLLTHICVTWPQLVSYWNCSRTKCLKCDQLKCQNFLSNFVEMCLHCNMGHNAHCGKNAHHVTNIHFDNNRHFCVS